MDRREVVKILEKQERRRFLYHLQSSATKEGKIPAMPSPFLRRYRYLIQGAGGVIFGSILGTSAFFFNYLLFVFLLHLEF